MKGLILAVLLLAGCNLATDPKVADIQRWTATCATYATMLTLINDNLEAGRLSKDSGPVKAFGRVDLSLRPICASETPPEGLDVATFRTMLDAQFVELARIKGELP